jgi:REP element-mobilizing transposase RayT
MLDQANTGPLWLKDSRIAGTVVETLRFGESALRLYKLHAFVVMPNHVHALFTPRAPLSPITRTIKGFTARRANRILGRSGSRFWQDESFDHWIRNEASFRRVIAYIESNPVKAGLVRQASDWPWSSASL